MFPGVYAAGAAQQHVGRHDATMRKLLKVALYFLVLSLVATGSFYVGLRTGEAEGIVFGTSELVHYHAFLDIQRSEGTDAAYEEALRGYLALLDAKKGKWDFIFSEKVYAMDSALAHARLAALAHKRGATEEANQQLSLAASFCPQIGWSECSAEKIAVFAQRLDSGVKK